ncbi:hypothetical protein AN643_01000 [Candidatus Epulonipiscioides saccharophilum]|nr:hypothetical protein AN643_01000 [Epulopiscium sp. SCG-B10WGA-EpuloB]
MDLDDLVEIAIKTEPVHVEYKVRSGDTLSTIAQSLRINREEITKNNPKIKNDVVILNSIIDIVAEIPKIDIVRADKDEAREFMVYIE